MKRIILSMFLVMAFLLSQIQFNFVMADTTIRRDANGKLHTINMNFDNDDDLANGLPESVASSPYADVYKQTTPGIYRVDGTTNVGSRTYAASTGFGGGNAIQVTVPAAGGASTDAFRLLANYEIDQTATYTTSADVRIDNNLRLNGVPVGLTFIKSDGTIAHANARFTFGGTSAISGVPYFYFNEWVSNASVRKYIKSGAVTTTAPVGSDSTYSSMVASKWYRFQAEVNFGAKTYNSWYYNITDDPTMQTKYQLATDASFAGYYTYGTPYFTFAGADVGANNQTIIASFDNVLIQNKVHITVDRATLEAKYNEYKAILDGANSAGVYSHASYAAFTSAITAQNSVYEQAKDLLDNPGSTGEQFADIYELLVTLEKLLKPAKAPTVTVTQSGSVQINSPLALAVQYDPQDYIKPLSCDFTVSNSSEWVVDSSVYRITTSAGEPLVDNKFEITDPRVAQTENVNIEFEKGGFYRVRARLLTPEGAVVATADYTVVHVTGGTPPGIPDPRGKLGFGATVTLFPCDETSIDPDDLFNGNDTAQIDAYLSGDGGLMDLNTKALLKGPFNLYNSAGILNKFTGKVDIKASANATLNISKFGSNYGSHSVLMSSQPGTKVVYTPNGGLFDGVDTKITLDYMFYGNAKAGMDALVRYDGGKEKTIRVIETTEGYTDRVKKYITIDEAFKDVESLTLSAPLAGMVYYPTVIFEVVNDYSGVENQQPYYRNRVAPHLETVEPSLPDDTILTPEVVSTVSLNEICSSNTTGNYNNSDWIELYNSDSEPVDISRYGLTDNPNNLRKWYLPENTVIPGNSFLMVYASNEAEAVPGGIHASFAISKGGETIVLSDTNEKIVSVINLPALEDNQTLGRYPDGGTTLKYMKDATPAAANVDTNSGVYLPSPKFSHNSGFYKSGFDLTIEAESGDIYYTLDGSNPSKTSRRWSDINSTTIKYTPDGTTQEALPDIVSSEFSGPISIINRTDQPNFYTNIKFPLRYNNLSAFTYAPTVKVDKAMIVRAAAIDSEGNMSEVATGTFFVGYEMERDFNNELVISMVADPEELFETTTGLMIRSDNDPEEAEGENSEHPMYIEMFEGDGKMVIGQNAGVRLRGYGSKVNDQRAFTIYPRNEYGKSTFAHPFFPENKDIFGNLITEYKSLGIKLSNSGGKMIPARYIDGVVQRMAKDMDQDEQEFRLCTLFINGEFWGSYYLQERVHETFIETNMGIDRDNVKLVKNPTASGYSGSLEDRAEQQADNAWLDKTDFTVPENLEELYRRFDVDHGMQYFASYIAMSNVDWGTFNFTQWKSATTNPDNRFESGKWRFLQNDNDGAYQAPTDGGFYNGFGLSFAAAMLKTPKLKDIFVNSITEALSNGYEPRRVIAEMQYNQDAITNDMIDKLAARYNYYSNVNESATSDTAIKIAAEAMRPNVLRRQANLLRLMANPSLINKDKVYTDHLKLPSDFVCAYLNVRVNDYTMGGVKTNAYTHDYSRGSFSSIYYTDFNQRLTAIPERGYELVGWNLSEGVQIVEGSPDSKEIWIKLPPQGGVATAVFGKIGKETVVISTFEELQEMAANVNVDSEYSADKIFVLANDIVAPSIPAEDPPISNHTPIGTVANPFMGIFDGQGHTISGLVTYYNLQGQGLFGYVGSEGEIRRVGVIDSSFTGLTVGTVEGKNIGAIAGNNSGLIENCYSVGCNIIGISTIGGIVGNNQGIVRNCFSTSTAQSDSGKATIGGIAGKTEGGAIINSFSVAKPVGKLEKGGVVTDLDGNTDTESTSVPAVNVPSNADKFTDGTVVNLLNERDATSIWAQGTSYPVFKEGISIVCSGGVVYITNAEALGVATLHIASYGENKKLLDYEQHTVNFDAAGSANKGIKGNFKTGIDGKIHIMLWNENLVPLYAKIPVTK